MAKSAWIASIGNSPQLSSTGSNGASAAAVRLAAAALSAWKSHGVASSASPAMSRGRRCASAVVSNPPMQYPTSAGRRPSSSTAFSARSSRPATKSVRVKRRSSGPVLPQSSSSGRMPLPAIHRISEQLSDRSSM